MIALKGIEVAISGRLASMTHGAAAALIAKSGGQYVAQPSAHTSYVVLGQEGASQTDPTQPTRVVQRARELQRDGVELEILTEREFLRKLVTSDDPDEVQTLYTIPELSRLLGVSGHRIRTWIRRGLLSPTENRGGIDYFDFEQVAIGRMLQGLVRSGARPEELQRRLGRLQQWLTADAETEAGDSIVTDDSGALRVRLEDGSVADDEGQLQFDFAPRKSARITQVQPHAPAHRQMHPFHAAGCSDEPWFTTGSSYEERGALEEAERAYRRALETEGPRPEILFNLGNVLYNLDRTADAAQCFLSAVELDAGYVDAWGNLGIALTDLGQGPEALAAYHEALTLNPDHADTHYNLAETLYQMGRIRQAREHWRIYLQKDPQSPWANHVRHRLLQEKG
ncbi:MAG: tetratricopeptide repeat protein [Planctomycetota bacterium]